MRETPPELGALRAAVSRSFGWRLDGTVVTESERAAMSATKRSECRWGPATLLLADLLAAERLFTETFV